MFSCKLKPGLKCKTKMMEHSCFCVLSQVTQLEDFFGSTDVFFAYGNERYSREDFDLDVEGKESYMCYNEH
jgi:hypothetical protein